MKKANTNLCALLMLGLIVLNCSSDTLVNDTKFENTADKLIVETVLADELMKEERIADTFGVIEGNYEIPSSADRAACDDCSPKPGNLSTVAEALKVSKYEYTGSSTQNANNYCKIGRFNTCNNWVVLTSGGNKSNRSELKMKYSMPFTQKNIMRNEMIVENVPSESSSARGLTISQIHNRGGAQRPLARVEIVKGKVRVKVAHKPTGSTTYSTYTLMDFKQGNRLYIKLQTNGDGKKINYYVKNKSTNVSSSKTITVTSEWQKSKYRNYFYFKAGAYQQAKSYGAKPRVSINRLNYYFNQ